MLVPKVARFFNAVPSTNTALLADIEAGASLRHGTVYVTRDQTGGRGQGKNTWHASPGDNLTLSLLLQPDRLSPSHLFALNAFTSLAVADTLEYLLPPHLACLVSVKWPNDVYVGDRKVAGILIQNGLRGDHLSWSVVGLGLNVNEIDFPPRLAETATSIRLLVGHEVPLDEVLPLIFRSFTERYESIANESFAALRIAYRDKLYLLNREAAYFNVAEAKRFRATTTGVSPSGLLELRLADGSTARFDVRQLRFLRE